MFVGDLINVQQIQFAKPDIATVYDTSAGEASEIRHKVLDYAAENNIPIAGGHIIKTNTGMVKKGNETQAFILE